MLLLLGSIFTRTFLTSFVVACHNEFLYLYWVSHEKSHWFLASRLTIHSSRLSDSCKCIMLISRLLSRWSFRLACTVSTRKVYAWQLIQRLTTSVTKAVSKLLLIISHMWPDRSNSRQSHGEVTTLIEILRARWSKRSHRIGQWSAMFSRRWPGFTMKRVNIRTAGSSLGNVRSTFSYLLKASAELMFISRANLVIQLASMYGARATCFVKFSSFQSHANENVVKFQYT